MPIVPFQIQKMSDAMYIEDKEEGMAQFLEVIAHLGLPKSPDSDYPETVRSKNIDLIFSYGKMLFPGKQTFCQ